MRWETTLLAVGWLTAATLGNGPLPPAEALKSFELADDRLAIELVAAEPDVIDPVAMAFDASGRIYVAEMRGFQLGPDGKGVPGLGRIRLLEDTDGDGRIDRSSVFAEGMFHPTAVLPAYGGVLVGAAPDILYFRDADGDGRAEERIVLFTGFGQSNHEQLLNSFQWGLDNWVHGGGGGNGGDIRPGDRPDAKPIQVRGRDFRFRLRPERLKALAASGGIHPAVAGGHAASGGGHPARLQSGETTAPSTNTQSAQTTRPALFSGSDFEFETTSGGGQYGLTADAAGRWLTCSNARHIQQIVLPERYLRRNPYLLVSGVLTDISDHGAAAKINRISPLEEWRVVRTRQRANSPDATRYSSTELVPGGFFTAACGITVYHGNELPGEFHEQAFVCDAANNLVHRDRLVDDGFALVARRVDEEKEFLASRDSWFRPVALSNGLDGCLYVLDMYREIIETPVSIPADILKTIDLEAGKDAGRIYRVRLREDKPRTVRLPDASRDLLPLLAHPNHSVRIMAQRLLVERQDRSVVEPLRRMVQAKPQDGASDETSTGWGRLHALCTLEGLSALDVESVLAGLRDRLPEVRMHALRLAEAFLEGGAGQPRPPADAPLVRAIVSMDNDPSAGVRFQLAFTLGSIQDEAALQAIARLAGRDAHDRWMRTALLSSVGGRAGQALKVIHQGEGGLLERHGEGTAEFIQELMAIIAARGDDAELAAALDMIEGDYPPEAAWWRAAGVEGLTQGLERVGVRRPVTQPSEDRKRVEQLILALIGDAQPAVRQAARGLAARVPLSHGPELAPRIEADLDVALDYEQPVQERVSAIEFLAATDPRKTAEPLLDLLEPGESVEIQKAVAAALIRAGRPETIAKLLGGDLWRGYTPAVREVVLDSVFARSQYLPILLTAIEKGDVPGWALGPARSQRLLTHRDAKIRARAGKLLTAATAADREKVYQDYLQVTRREGDPARGKEVFRINCAACHALEGTGSSVGPDLASVRDRDPAAILHDILNPSATLVPGYSYYLVETHDGEAISGLISAESANTITIRQREGVERTLLRSNIASIQASTLSMMPGDYERSIGLQEMADLIAYLKAPK